MQTVARWLILMALGAGPLAVKAQAVMYIFTGVVTNATGSYITVAAGSVVTGTYTITFANSKLTSGAFGDPFWSRQETTGTANSTPSSSAYVFSSTAKVGSVSYQTAAPGTLQSGSSVGVGQNGTTWFAAESQIPDSNNSTSSSVQVVKRVVPLTSMAYRFWSCRSRT